MCLAINVNSILATKRTFRYRNKNCLVVYKGFYVLLGLSGEAVEVQPGMLCRSNWSENPYTVTSLPGKVYLVEAKLTEQRVDLHAVDTSEDSSWYVGLTLPDLGMHAYLTPSTALFRPKFGEPKRLYRMSPMLVDTSDIQLFGAEHAVVIKKGILPRWDEIQPLVEQDLKNLDGQNKLDTLGKLLHRENLDLRQVKENYRTVCSAVENMWKNRR